MCSRRDAPLTPSCLGFHCQTVPGWGGVSLVSWCWKTARTRTRAHPAAAAGASPSSAHSGHQEASPGDRRAPDRQSGMCARLCAVCYGLSTFVAQRGTTSQPNVGVWTEVRCHASDTSKRVCVPGQHPAAKRLLKASFNGFFHCFAPCRCILSSGSVNIFTCEGVESHTERPSVRHGWPQHPLFHRRQAAYSEHFIAIWSSTLENDANQCPYLLFVL